MVVTIDRDVLERFRGVSCYNSPYDVHREGRAVDLYPGHQRVPSPVAGTVRSSAEFGTPKRPGTTDTDVLLVVDTGEYLARMLHVDPIVSRGETVAVGDTLGRPFRSGYFDPWVAPHVHLEFRPLGSNSRRARGGLPIKLDLDPIAVPWDGTGTVVELGPGYAALDRPRHPAPGEGFAGIAADGGAIDGGLPHYGTGCVYGDGPPGAFLGHELAVGGTDGAGRPLVHWDGCRVTANGHPVSGLSFTLARDGAFGAKLIDPPSLAFGDHVHVHLEPAGEDNAE